PDRTGKDVRLNLGCRIVSIRLTGRENPVEYEWDEMKEFIQVGEMNG
ncbi:signal peptidase, partial [Enterococcus faecium]